MLEKLSKKQKLAVDFVIKTKQCALFCEQRTGKTWISTGVIEVLMSPTFEGCLVVPLTNKLSTWDKTLRTEIPQLNIAHNWEDYKKLSTPKLYLEHYEGLIRLKKSQAQRFRKHPWKIVVADESQRIKDRGSRQSRSLGLIKKAEYRVALSGTPIDESPVDLWAQFKFARPTLFGTNWGDFDLEFLKPTGYMGYKRKFKKEMFPGFMERIGPYIFRMTKEEVGIQEGEVILRPVEMRGKQGRLYREMEDEMVTEVLSRRVTAKLKITQIVKLQQFCNGFVIDDEGDTHVVGRAKIRDLEELLDDVQLPAVVFCKHRQDLLAVKQLAKSLGITHRVLFGKVKDRAKSKSRTRMLENFQNRKYDLLICQIRTGGVGVDLWKANSLIFFSITHSYIDFVQAKARANHYSRKKPAKIYLIFCKDSIDEDIYTTILSKQSVSKNLFNKLKQRSLKYGKR